MIKWLAKLFMMITWSEPPCKLHWKWSMGLRVLGSVYHKLFPYAGYPLKKFIDEFRSVDMEVHIMFIVKICTWKRKNKTPGTLVTLILLPVWFCISINTRLSTVHVFQMQCMVNSLMEVTQKHNTCLNTYFLPIKIWSTSLFLD